MLDPKTFVTNVKTDNYDIYVGRGSKWGNPFSHLKQSSAKWHVSSRDEAIDSYAKWIQTQPELVAALPELKGKILGCWCKPKRCHAEILAKLANKEINPFI